MFYKPMPELTPEEVLDYLRKSRSDDPLMTVEEVLSKHEAMLDEWAEKHLGGIVPEKNKFREIVSGETLKERPEITKLLRLIESPRYKAVKVVEPQRLTRGDLEDIGKLMKLLKLTNTLVITPQRIYDLRDEYDWDAFERELKRGNDYLEYTKKILNRGRLASVAAGNYIGSIAPYGFNKKVEMEGKRKCPTLEENKEQADVVRMIFDMYVNKDMGRSSICNTLDEMGIKPPKGKHWSPPALKDLLENIHYIGKVKWNWRKTVAIVEEGEVLATRPKSKIGEYLIFEGRHDGIVSEELFYAARDKQGRNHRAKPKTKVRNPFASLLYCSCGRAMSLRFYKRKDGTEKAPPRLLCDGQKYCKSGSVLYEELFARVCDVLEQCIEDFEIRIKNDEGDSIKLHARLVKNLEKKLKELQAKELSQWEQQSHPDEDQRMPAHIFKQLNEKVRADIDKVQKELCKAYESAPDPIDYEEKVARFKEALEALRDPDVDPADKNRLLKACIERIDYKREAPLRAKDPSSKRKGSGGHWTTPPFEIDVKLKV